jgi:hypothetical protein
MRGDDARNLETHLLVTVLVTLKTRLQLSLILGAFSLPKINPNIKRKRPKTALQSYS